MKIVFNAATPVTLADSPANVPMTNLRLNGEAIAQEVPLFRAPAVSYLDRGHRRTEITFAVTRGFSTPQLAEDFLLQHDVALQGNADILIIEADGTTLRYLRNAIVRSQSSAVGCTIKTSYRLQGGLLTTT